MTTMVIATIWIASTGSVVLIFKSGTGIECQKNRGRQQYEFGGHVFCYMGLKSKPLGKIRKERMC